MLYPYAVSSVTPSNPNRCAPRHTRVQAVACIASLSRRCSSSAVAHHSFILLCHCYCRCCVLLFLIQLLGLVGLLWHQLRVQVRRADEVRQGFDRRDHEGVSEAWPVCQRGVEGARRRLALRSPIHSTRCCHHHLLAWLFPTAHRLLFAACVHVSAPSIQHDVDFMTLFGESTSTPHCGFYHQLICLLVCVGMLLLLCCCNGE